jgi:hypothetical protein
MAAVEHGDDLGPSLRAVCDLYDERTVRPINALAH